MSLCDMKNNVYHDCFRNEIAHYDHECLFQGDWLMGFPAHGGSNVKADLKNQLAFAYVTNGQKVGVGDDVHTFARLQNAIYQCI